MTTEASSGFSARQLTGKAAPFIIVALVVTAVRTPLAATYPLAALLLFLWIVSDTLMLSLMARTAGRPSGHAILGVLAAASFTVWFSSPSDIREVLWGTPVIAGGMAIIILGHLAWATMRARRVLNAPENAANRWIAAASEILPAALVRLAVTELMVIHMALFRWGGPADVPANCRAFPYHKHLAPMCATLLVLAAIEIAVFHLLIGHWSRSMAVIMFVLSDVGFVYMVGLIKSFRFRPVLLTPEGVRIRAGFLIDQFIPLAAIGGIETSFAGDRVRDPATLDTSLLAWPNILLRLDQPMQRHSLLRGSKPFSIIGFRLDDPEPFVRLLLWRLGQKAS